MREYGFSYSLYGKMQVSENLYSRIFYVVVSKRKPKYMHPNLKMKFLGQHVSRPSQYFRKDYVTLSKLIDSQ